MLYQQQKSKMAEEHDNAAVVLTKSNSASFADDAHGWYHKCETCDCPGAMPEHIYDRVLNLQEVMEANIVCNSAYGATEIVKIDGKYEWKLCRRKSI